MTEKTIKHELYKHGSYLHSLKESGSSFVNIDDEIKKLEELFQLASKKDHQPTFVVGEYVAVEMGADLSGLMRIEELKDTQDSEGDKVAGCWGRVFNTALKDFDGYSSFELSMTKPATAEQIATFQRAEHFASKGRKLDEFQVGDRVNCSEIPFDNGCYMGDLKIEKFVGKQFVAESETSFYPFNLDEINKVTLIQTAEELQEVEHGN